MQGCGKDLSDHRLACWKEATAPGWPIYKVKFRAEDFVEDDRKKDSYFLIGRPRFANHSPMGRATRGYVAYDMTSGKLVFLKDTWRPDSTRIRTEKEIYIHLHKHRVRNIATLICGGDVGEKQQRTLTQDFEGEDGYGARIHYRLVVKQIGRSLEDYKKSREMVLALQDAIIGASNIFVSSILP